MIISKILDQECPVVLMDVTKNNISKYNIFNIKLFKLTLPLKQQLFY